MAALFKKFTAIYLQRWTDQFRSADDLSVAMSEWGQGLADLSGDEIKCGIAACRAALAWPPTIAEFRGLARKNVSLGAAYRVYRPALPKPVNRELAARELSKIRAVL